MAIGRRVEDVHFARRRVAHGHHGTAATIEIQGFLTAELAHFRREFIVAHADGDAGLASIHDEDRQPGPRRIQAHGGSRVAGFSAVRNHRASVDQQGVAAHHFPIIGPRARQRFNRHRLIFVDDKTGLRTGAGGPDFSIRHRRAVGERPEVGAIRGIGALAVVDAARPEKAAVDDEIKMFARGNLRRLSKSIEAYYRDQFVPKLKQSGSSEVPLAEVSSKIRELLTQEKVSELLVSWLQTLRSEGHVHIPGVTSSANDPGVQSQ